MTQVLSEAPAVPFGSRLWAVAGSQQSKKLIGVFLFLLILYGVMLAGNPNARTLGLHQFLATRIGLDGIISLGVGVLIISGGIDLSIGSLVALSSTLLAILLGRWEAPSAAAMFLVLILGATVGLGHGLVVTRLRVQPFVVTLCGLFIYRGLARVISGDSEQVLGDQFAGLQTLLVKRDLVFGLPNFFVILVVLAAVIGLFLHFSVFGRYLYAIGSNERAARYAGIPTAWYKIAAYMLCSTLASFLGILLLFYQGSVMPSKPEEFLELYAIAGAVLGGCSLRGGEGTVLGILAGTTIVRLLPTLTNMWHIPSQLTDIVIGVALLLGAVLDETIRRRQAVRAGE